MNTMAKDRPRSEPRFPRLLAVVGLLLVLALSACVAQRQYQQELIGQHGGNPCRGPGVDLCYVEFDDQGALFDGRQVEAASQLILDTEKDPVHYGGVIVVTFTHGWEHNAERGDANVQFFQDQLKTIAQAEALDAGPDKQYPCKDTRLPRRVIGVYMGWRGRVFEGVLNGLTFWDRKDTAQRVGARGLFNTLMALRDATYSWNRAADAPHPNRLFLIGHSFGGAALFSATSQILQERMVDEHHEGSHRQTDVADLVVLINPAFEAAQLEPLLRTAVCYKTQHLRLAIFTSESDDATGSAFPVGRFFSDYSLSHRQTTSPFARAHAGAGKDDGPRGPSEQPAESLDQWAADQDAVGHFRPFQTHRLVKLPNHPSDPSQDRDIVHDPYELYCPESSTEAGERHLNLMDEGHRLAGAMQYLPPPDKPHAMGPRHLAFNQTGMCLVNLRPNDNPQKGVFNVAVSSEILDGHTINQTHERMESFTRFLVSFMAFSDTMAGFRNASRPQDAPAPAACFVDTPATAPATPVTGGGMPAVASGAADARPFPVSGRDAYAADRTADPAVPRRPATRRDNPGRDASACVPRT